MAIRKRVLGEPRKVTSSGNVIRLCPTLATREQDPMAGGSVSQVGPPPTPGKLHQGLLFCIDGDSSGGIQIKKTHGGSKIISVGQTYSMFLPI